MHLNYSTICGAATCHELVKRKKSGLEVVNPDKFVRMIEGMIEGHTPRKGHFSRVLRSSPACHTAKSRFASNAATAYPPLL